MKKDFLILSVIIFLVVILVGGTRIQSVDDYYLTHLDDITEDSQTVFLEVKCDTIFSNLNLVDSALLSGGYIPSNGIILQKKQYVLRSGDTAFSVLSRVSKSEKIPLSYVGGGSGEFSNIYVNGINHIYEFSCGALSGWLYKVNDKSVAYGSDRYKLKDGDTVSFLYTCDLGRDVGGDFWRP